MLGLEDTQYLPRVGARRNTVTLAVNWEFKDFAWSSPECASTLSKYFRKAAKGYLESNNIITRIGSIPVPSRFRDKNDVVARLVNQDALQVTLTRVQLAMEFLNYHTEKESWLGPDTPEDYPDYVPRLFVRDDWTEEQICGILSLVHCCARSQQLARELASERLIGDAILSIFGPHYPYWTAIPRLVKRNMVARHGCLPLAGFLLGDTDMPAGAVMTARRHMTEVLHPTMTLLAGQHCKRQGWRLDRRLTKADAAVQLDKKFFVFSVLYSRRLFWVDINFPAIKYSQSTKQFNWMFISAPVMRTECELPMSIPTRLAIFQALLFIEQHVYVLKHQLEVSL
ncbi:uncharacterized protein B0H18DRAFT_1208022 [Fomitopsis serialis]|uniref:uncharacterized protein n=1 Tax=Fomitopsis serialis TaxID=139415 RepID=UPI00200813D2|nr:uncharacterized protein B0H18DRAFT_1208022 [Neoantrodia serialis]KAH9933930.1 hypothetical protein B0H18DRAFT_1208022 [Neoantrodia serialis]